MLTVTVLVLRVRPVLNVSGTSYALAAVYAAVPSVPPVPMLSVELSVPASVKVLLTANVFALVIVSVPVLVVIVSPLTVVGVIAAKLSVIAGVLDAFATDPEMPFAVTTDTVVTDPPPEVDASVPPDRDSPDPTVISSIAPVLAVVRPRSRAVDIVSPLAVASPDAA